MSGQVSGNLVAQGNKARRVFLGESPALRRAVGLPTGARPARCGKRHRSVPRLLSAEEDFPDPFGRSGKELVAPGTTGASEPRFRPRRLAPFRRPDLAGL